MEAAMDLRERVQEATKAAMRAREADRLSTLRLIASAFKDRDIAARGEGQPSPVPDDGLLPVLAKMAKQRAESARAYDEGARPDLAAKERAEIAVIEEFLPRPLSEAETEAAIDAAVAEAGATALRDMGRVMAILRERHAGALDMGQVGAQVKARLA
jgi:uncharacterized protein YqeY